MTITPEEAEAMVALALEQAAAFVKAEAGSFPDEVAWAVEDLATAILTLRPDAFAALADLRKADRAVIERLRADLKAIKAERDDALTFLDNAVSKAPEPLKALGKWLADMMDEDDWPTAERYLNAAVKSVAEARLTAIEADRVKVAETALRMAAGLCHGMAEQVADAVLTGLPEQARIREGMEAAFTKGRHRILAITHAAVLSAIDSTCTTT